MSESQSTSQGNPKSPPPESRDVNLSIGDNGTWSQLDGPAPSLEPGSVILEKNKILELVGVGGMGSVYRALHMHLGTYYAFKCINREQPKDASWRRFQNEAKAAHILDHPNLIKVHDFGLLPGRRAYFIMDFVDGTTIADEIQKYGRLPIERCMRIFIQCAFAIAYAHEHGVIHRDLKSSNIMLVKNTENPSEELVKVVDFGIAKLTGADEFNQQTLTKTGEIFGSPLYMSPEQCMGLPVDHRCDLYSLGCVFFEALTGTPPFFGENALATMMKHQSDPPPPLKQASMGIDFPEELEEIIRKLLEKDPARRYPSANVLASQLIALEGKLKSNSKLPESKTSENASQSDTSRGFSSVSHKSGPGQFFKGNRAGQLFISLLSFILGMTVSFLLIESELVKPKQDSSAPPIVPPELTKSTTPDRKDSAAIPLAQTLSKITTRRHLREFDFPRTGDIGALSLEDGTSMDCRGRIEIPAKHLIGFFPSYTALQNHPDLFTRFMGDDFALLYLSKNEAVTPEVLKHIPHLTGLKALNLKFSAVDDRQITMLNQLQNLCCLNVGYSEMTGTSLKKLTGMPRLTALSIDNLSGIPTCLPVICKMQQLLQLGVSKDGLQNDDLKLIASLKNLRILSLNSNKALNDEGLKNLLPLKNLRWLNMYDTKVTPACASTIRQFPNLKTLILPADQWSEKDQQNFARQFPKIDLFYGHVEPQIDKSSLPGFAWDTVGLN